jgi:hypothetical protein
MAIDKEMRFEPRVHTSRGFFQSACHWVVGRDFGSQGSEVSSYGRNICLFPPTRSALCSILNNRPKQVKKSDFGATKRRLEFIEAKSAAADPTWVLATSENHLQPCCNT